MAPGAEEGRDKLRKAAGRSKYPTSRGYPNGETRLRKAQSSGYEHIVTEKGTWGTETSKYPQEKKERSIFRVAASERERGQTTGLRSGGVADCIKDADG